MLFKEKIQNNVIKQGKSPCPCVKNYNLHALTCIGIQVFNYSVAVIDTVDSNQMWSINEQFVQMELPHNIIYKIPK